MGTQIGTQIENHYWRKMVGALLLKLANGGPVKLGVAEFDAIDGGTIVSEVDFDHLLLRLQMPENPDGGKRATA